MSQGSEDCFNHAKNSRLVKGKKRFRTPQKSWAAMLARRVPEAVHRYTALQPDVGVPATSVVQEGVFTARPQLCELKLDGLVSTSQRPKWYTCGAEDASRVHADVQLFRDMRSVGSAHLCETTWLGKLCCWQHAFVMRKVGEDSRAWFWPLRHWGDSSVLVWPVTRRAFKNSATVWFDLACGLKEPLLVTFADLDRWKVMSVQWRSPAWQFAQVPEAYRELPTAVRLVATGSETTILKLAAEKAFWRLDVSFLRSLARHIGLEVSPGASLLETCVACIRHGCTTTDLGAMQRLRSRLAMDDETIRNNAELLEVEELDQVFDRQDIKVINKAQEDAVRRLRETKDL